MYWSTMKSVETWGQITLNNFILFFYFYKSLMYFN